MSHSPASRLLRLPAIGIDILWMVIILSGALILISLIPLPPNDYWWHIKIGEQISTQGSIPAANIYSWALPPDTPFFYGAWLAEFLLYQLHKMGGLSLAMAMRTALAGILFFLVALEARRLSSSWRIAALSLAFASLMSINNFHVRPQVFAFLPFILTFSLLSRHADRQLDRRWLLALPLLMIFWVNVHGSFILGLILPAIFFAGEVLGTFSNRSPEKQSRLVRWSSALWLAGIGFLNALATLVNPRFTGIVSYVIKLMTDQPSQKLIEEWQSPSPAGLPNLTFFVSILVILACLAYSRFRPTPTQLLLVLAFLWLAWSGVRYIIWYAVVCMPILAKLVYGLPLPASGFAPRRNFLNLAILLALFIPVLAVQPWFVRNLPLPQTYLEQVQLSTPAGPLLTLNTPVGIERYLKENPAVHLFNEMGYGSYLIWALPEQKVFTDPRVELYPYQIWQDYIRISAGTRYIELLDQYQVDAILLDSQLQPGLAAALPGDPAWQREYQLGYAELWRRTPPPGHQP